MVETAKTWLLQIFIVLHTVSGQPIEINTILITHLRGPDPLGSHSFVEGAKCMVNLSDGKYVTVIETCAEVGKLIERQKK